MIRYVDRELADSLRAYTDKRDVFACRIACLLQSYGTGYDFAEYYIQLDDQGTPTAAASKYYSDMTVMLSEHSDLPELASFIEMSSPASVLLPDHLLYQADKDMLCRLSGIYGRELFTIMKHTAITPKQNPSSLAIISDPPLQKVWELLSSCGDDELSVPENEDFLLDMSHKLRHGTAAIRACIIDGSIAGAAMTVAESQSCAVIGAVAVSGKHRRCGIGSACVDALCADLNARNIKDIYIIRETNRNSEFYCSLGFEDTGSALLLTKRNQA